jgi:hypothetical protein
MAPLTSAASEIRGKGAVTKGGEIVMTGDKTGGPPAVDFAEDEEMEDAFPGVVNHMRQFQDAVHKNKWAYWRKFKQGLILGEGVLLKLMSQQKEGKPNPTASVLDAVHLSVILNVNCLAGASNLPRYLREQWLLEFVALLDLAHHLKLLVLGLLHPKIRSVNEQVECRNRRYGRAITRSACQQRWTLAGITW